MAVRGDILPGHLAHFLLNLALIRRVLLQLGMIYQRTQQTRGALLRLTPLLSDAAIRNAPDVESQEQPESCHISVQQVSLSLDGAQILDHVSLEIPAGRSLRWWGLRAAVRPYSSIYWRACWILIPGSVRINGVDVRHWDLSSLRRLIAYVPQTTFLFSQELQENVRMGQESLPDSGLLRAVEISHLAEDLPQLPHGLATRVGERE